MKGWAMPTPVHFRIFLANLNRDLSKADIGQQTIVNRYLAKIVKTTGPNNV